MLVTRECCARRAFEQHRPVSRLLGRAQHLELDSRREQQPRLLRGVDIDIAQLLVTGAVTGGRVGRGLLGHEHAPWYGMETAELRYESAGRPIRHDDLTGNC